MSGINNRVGELRRLYRFGARITTDGKIDKKERKQIKREVRKTNRNSRRKGGWIAHDFIWKFHDLNNRWNLFDRIFKKSKPADSGQVAWALKWALGASANRILRAEFEYDDHATKPGTIRDRIEEGKIVVVSSKFEVSPAIMNELQERLFSDVMNSVGPNEDYRKHIKDVTLEMLGIRR